MSRSILAPAAILLALAAPAALGQGLPSIEKRLDAILAKAQEKNRFVGLSVLVIDQDKGSFKKHYGFRDHERTKAPDDDTMYEIGSITKVFARLAIAAQDKIKPDDLLADHLPEGIRAPRPHGKDLAIKHLMTHTAGLARVPCAQRASDQGVKTTCYGYDPKNHSRDPYKPGTRELTFKFLNEYSYTVEEFPSGVPIPGDFHHYSNAGIGLLGELLGEAKGTSFEEVLNATILRPLGMTRTKIAMPCDENDSCDNLADTHQMKPDQSEWLPWVPFHVPGLPAAGAIRSSLGDMGKFLRANMDPSSSPLADVLAKGQTRLMGIEQQHNANICEDPDQKGFCNKAKKFFTYAWQTWDKPGVITHGGRTYGSSSWLSLVDQGRFGIVILTNSSYVAVAERVHYPLSLTKCIWALKAQPGEAMPAACQVVVD